ncbi:MAG: hypothetical protein M3Y65_05750 [Pseudomonadota bacterium]|nr:hypothetical protein [Pseudomonadota bacterium]
MGTRIYEKTDKGREEIATRKHQLPMRLRSVLVMIDGRQSLSGLLAHLAKLGLNQVSIDELTAQEFIRVIPGTEPVVVPEVVLVARLPTAVRRMQKLREANLQLNTLQLIELEQAEADVVSAVAALQSSPEEPASAAAAAAASAVDSAPAASLALLAVPPALSDAQRFESVHKFYNETIRGNLGLRGFGLQLKVEKAGNLDDLRALRVPYLEAVKKSRSNEMAQALDVRLSSLLAAESVA